MKRRLLSSVAVILVFLASPAYSQSVPELLERLKPSVAFVLVSGEQQTASGTAFVVHSQGMLATALHVVEDARDITVQLHGGQSFAAEVVAANVETDLAVLRVERTGLTALKPVGPYFHPARGGDIGSWLSSSQSLR